MKSINRLLIPIVIAILLIASACSKKVITSETSKTTITKEKVDTLVEAVVPVPEKRLTDEGKLKENVKIVFLPGTPGKDKTIILTKYDERLKMRMQTTIDSLGNYKMECVSEADSLRVMLTLQNEKVTVLTEKVTEYEVKESLLKKWMRALGSGAILLLLFALWAGWKLLKS